MNPRGAATKGARGRGRVDRYPTPPSLHWALVLLFTILTGGFFVLVWIFRQAAWVRRIDPTCKALFVLAVTFPLPVILALLPRPSLPDDLPLMLAMLLGRLISIVTFAWSYLSMRRVIEARFDLHLSGLMTFFFNVFYLQHYMTRIAKREHTRL